MAEFNWKEIKQSTFNLAMRQFKERKALGPQYVLIRKEITATENTPRVLTNNFGWVNTRIF